MKNLLTTLMVLMIATAAGAALAGDMDWKFYGKLHQSLDYLNDGDQTSLTHSSNTSRFGFKGGTELNETFTLIWQFESSINIASGGGTLSNRNTFLGLKGEFGQLRFGRHDTPFKTLGRKATFFYDELGDFRQTTMGWDRRLSNIAAWVSPDWDGFGIFAAFQFDQADIVDKSQTAYSAMASYAKDGIFLGVAVEGLSEGHVDSYDSNPDPDVEELVFGDTPMGIRAAGKYDAEKFAVSALFQSLTDYTGEWDLSGADPVFMAYKSTTIGGEILYRAATKWNVKANFYIVNPDTDAEDAAATADIDESDTKTTLMSFGVDHIVTKAVMFYAQVVMISNGDAACGGLGGTTIDGDKMFGNGHGTYIDAFVKDDGTCENPMGVSFGAVVKF